MKKLLTAALLVAMGSAQAVTTKKKNHDGFVQTRILTNEVTGASNQVSGKVLKTIDAKTYTYIKIKTAEGDVWAASTSVKLKEGETVILDKIYPMDNFHSKTLDRTFEKILFVQNVAVLNKKTR